jgi:hypothetical protein
VIFDITEGAFSGIAMVSVGRYQLVLHVIDGEKVLQSGGHLVVESFEFWLEALDCEFLMDGIICLDPF